MTINPHSDTNEPKDKALSLQYDGNTAPKLTAAGEGHWAEEIIRVAREHKVPIYENESLVDMLSKLEIGDEIPTELYLIIAQLIAFVYHLKEQHLNQ